MIIHCHNLVQELEASIDGPSITYIICILSALTYVTHTKSMTETVCLVQTYTVLSYL